jgi:hypothetical protein
VRLLHAARPPVCTVQAASRGATERGARGKGPGGRSARPCPR